MNYILTPSDDVEEVRRFGGGKAGNMAQLSRAGFPVPHWICLTTEAFHLFVEANGYERELARKEPPRILADRIEKLFLEGSFPASVKDALGKALSENGLVDPFLAVRSSGTDEDSPDYSFAGQYASYLFQRGDEAVEQSVRKCWASAYSERALAYRMEHGLSTENVGVGVLVQAMVNAEVAGVAFSRNPIRPLDRDHLLISATWGLGEGVVSGMLETDHFEVHRDTRDIHADIARKRWALRQAAPGGLEKVELPVEARDAASLTDAQVREVADLAIRLEEAFGTPQDCEWGYEDGKLFCLQTRPVTSLPPEAFFDTAANGQEPVLWDNSNIIESYCGVTTPLTFSFVIPAYHQVYIQFCDVMGVPKELIEKNEAAFRNLLGLIRGRIYYNLVSWYRLLLLLPGTASNKEYMETMMGVKQGLRPELASLFDFMNHPPEYSKLQKARLITVTLVRFLTIDSIVSRFQAHFNAVYEKARQADLAGMSLRQQMAHYQHLTTELLARWQAPIINDFLCMIFFGLLKKLTGKWMGAAGEDASLQNDLLCGEGDLASTEPTKMLMRIAEKIDQGPGAFRDWFLATDPAEAYGKFRELHPGSEVTAAVETFLDRFGFRCVNELKLEEKDLYDDPSFALNAIASYVRTRSYSIEEMEERERQIRASAEKKVKGVLHGFRRVVFFWVLKHARKAVSTRENLRFDRTKSFGLVRHLFRAMGENLAKLGVLDDPGDIFYLTRDEIFAFIEGRAPSNHMAQAAQERKIEFENYRNTPAPPDRFLTYGAVGTSVRYYQVLADADLLRDESVSDDPDLLKGTPCCPGVVEGVVRVVKEMKDAEGLEGQILVTERTDPGWVPLYPSCSGLLIERGSLLSHSAVVARELGLPTIVGISGGMMQRLTTGQRVRVDAGKGEVRILHDPSKGVGP